MAENEMQNYNEEYLDFEHVSESSDPLPDVGEYVCRLSKLDPGQSRKGDPMVTAAFDVLEGQFEGHTIKFYFWLGAKIDPKTKRVFAPGAAEVKASLTAIGAPLDAETLKRFPRDATKVAKMFGHPFYGKRVRIRILNVTEKRKDQETGEKVEQTVKRAKIVGLATAGGPALPTDSATSSAPVPTGVV